MVFSIQFIWQSAISSWYTPERLAKQNFPYASGNYYSAKMRLDLLKKIVIWSRIFQLFKALLGSFPSAILDWNLQISQNQYLSLVCCLNLDVSAFCCWSGTFLVPSSTISKYYYLISVKILWFIRVLKVPNLFDTCPACYYCIFLRRSVFPSV